jgi:hypothetical protein
MRKLMVGAALAALFAFEMDTVEAWVFSRGNSSMETYFLSRHGLVIKILLKIWRRR